VCRPGAGRSNYAGVTWRFASPTACIVSERSIFFEQETPDVRGARHAVNSCLNGGSRTPGNCTFTRPHDQHPANTWLQRGCKLDKTFGAGNRGDPVARITAPPLPHLAPDAKEVAYDLHGSPRRLEAGLRALTPSRSSHRPAPVRVDAMQDIGTAGDRLEQKSCLVQGHCWGGARRVSRPEPMSARAGVGTSPRRCRSTLGWTGAG
jgi:hypothetical protein